MSQIRYGLRQYYQNPRLGSNFHNFWIRNRRLFDNVGMEGLEMEIVKKKFTKMCTNDEINEDCSICYSDYTEMKSQIVMPICNHKFHSVCQTEWFKRKTTCPLCNRNLRESLMEMMSSENDANSSNSDVSTQYIEDDEEEEKHDSEDNTQTIIIDTGVNLDQEKEEQGIDGVINL